MNKVNKQYEIENQEVTFNNNAFYCIGTGRMGLALQKHYYEQLKIVQEQIGFKYIRGHGLFNEDLSIYNEYKDENGNIHAEYNFTYLDLVMDSYLSLKIKPFLELGFMPKKIASGENTVFYWKGNITPPADYNKWTDLIKATLSHLIYRYGRDEVITWPVEVWNEPNLEGFWKDADLNEYLNLYDKTSRAVKEVDNSFQVGGPAICGVNYEFWIRKFLEFVIEHKSPLDFLTRHHYTSFFPEYTGHYGYVELNDIEHSMDQVQDTRAIVDSYEQFKGLKIHITEYNTSYIPNCPVHDTNMNAAYIAYLLSVLGNNHESYSYWTFGDIFEECGVPFTPFHGGFGLVSNGLIRKPTFWTFAFYKKLNGTCVLKQEDALIVKTKDGSYRGILWNLDGHHKNKNREIKINISSDNKPMCLTQYIVDEDYCNPLKVWHDIGEPAGLSKEQNNLLQDASTPLVTTKRLVPNSKKVLLDMQLSPNAVVYFELKDAVINSDRGFSYERAINEGTKPE